MLLEIFDGCASDNAVARLGTDQISHRCPPFSDLKEPHLGANDVRRVGGARVFKRLLHVVDARARCIGLPANRLRNLLPERRFVVALRQIARCTACVAGYDFGAEGSKTLILVYNLRDVDQLYNRFAGVDGSAYLVGGVGVTFQTYDDVVLAPIRSGVGLRLGANVGYLKYTRTPTWNPF